MPGGPPIGVGGTILGQPKRYYSAKDLANLARDAGFRDDVSSNDDVGGHARQRDGTSEGRYSELQVAVAVALAESGGDSQAVNSSSGATGLWQGYPGSEALLDPERNAQMAWTKYIGAGYSFSPWSAFNSRAYITKLPAAALAVRSTHRDRPAFTGGGTGFVHDVIAFTGDIGHDLAAFFGFITSGSTWLRLGEVLGGAVLLLLALYLLISKTSVGKDLKSVATKGAA
jgi:hypothetical protein